MIKKIIKRIVALYKKINSLLNLLIVRIKYKKILYPSTAPKYVRIDASTLCQLRCEGCGFQKNNYRQLGGGYLSFDDYRKFIENNLYIERVELSNYGEIFLNPELIDIMKYSYEKGIALEARMGVNFNTVSDEQLQALVDYQFRFISFSIDGASQEAYCKYRIGGNFDTVINNIKKLQDIKEKNNSMYPLLSWQYVLNQYNEQDIPKAKQLAKQLNIPIWFKLNFLPSYIPSDVDYVKKQTGLDCVTRKEYKEKYGVAYAEMYCQQVFNDPQINWDGKLLGCCLNEYGFNINVFDDGLLNALNNKDYVAMKEFVLMKNSTLKRHSKLVCKKCQAKQ